MGKQLSSSSSWDSELYTSGFLAKDLAHKEVFNVPILDHYLRARELSPDWVAQCRQHLSGLPAVKKAVDSLKDIQGDPYTSKWNMHPHLVSDFRNSWRNHIQQCVALYTQLHHHILAIYLCLQVQSQRHWIV